MISINNVSVLFGDYALLDSISFLVNKRDRIGLTGRNGAGKSTLLKILAGVQEPSEGSVSVPSGLKIGYLPQTKVYAEGKTVRKEAETAFNDVLDLQAELERLHRELGERTDYESDSYMALIDKLNVKTEMLHMRGADNMDGEVEVVLKGLGFRQEDLERRCEEFSGRQHAGHLYRSSRRDDDPSSPGKRGHYPPERRNQKPQKAVHRPENSRGSAGADSRTV